MTKVQRNSKFSPTKFFSLNSAVMHCHTIVLHFTLIYRGISPSSAARAIPHTPLLFAFFLSQHARNKRYFLFTLYSITPFLPPLSRSRFLLALNTDRRCQRNLQEHFKLSSLSHHFNSEIKPLMTNKVV